MGKTGFRCKIPDWYGIHSGFNLLLRPDYTALVGPNGAGKTTLLLQLEEIAKERGYEVFHYSNLRDGGENARQQYLREDSLDYLATSLCSSEGEQLALNFGKIAGKIGGLVRKSVENDTPLFILLDGLDSGASIDRTRELMALFRLMERDADETPGGTEHELYIVAAVNSYELARYSCVDVRTGKPISFGNYAEYVKYICNYFDC